MLIGLIPIARRAIVAAFAGSPFSIEMLMTIAALGAVIIGATEEAAAVIFLFLIGELLEGVAAGKARASIQSLTMLMPKTAFLEIDGQTREVSAKSLAVGAVILARPGDRIPADGIIVGGESANRAFHRQVFQLGYTSRRCDRRVGGGRPAAFLWWCMGQLDLQGSCHSPDRLSGPFP